MLAFSRPTFVAASVKQHTTRSFLYALCLAAVVNVLCVLTEVQARNGDCRRRVSFAHNIRFFCAQDSPPLQSSERDHISTVERFDLTADFTLRSVRLQ